MKWDMREYVWEGIPVVFWDENTQNFNFDIKNQGELARMVECERERYRRITKLLENKEPSLWKTRVHNDITFLMRDYNVQYNKTGSVNYFNALILFRGDPLTLLMARWALWSNVRKRIWEKLQPPQPPIPDEAVIEIIKYALPFQGFINHKIGGLRGSLALSEDDLDFITPEFEKKGLRDFIDYIIEVYNNQMPDPDLRYYIRRFDHKKAFKLFVIKSTRILYRYGLIERENAYKRIANLFLAQ